MTDMLSNKDAMSLGGLRQSLLRGYGRLRQAQAQGRWPEDTECVLELLGDPQVLTLVNSRYQCNLRIPLVYVASWNLPKGRLIKEALANIDPEHILTLYRRRQDESDLDETGISHIHGSLVRVVKEYIQRNESRGGLLLDLIWAPRPEEHDHDEITSENWAGFHGRDNGPHWLLGDLADAMPEQVREVNSLIRLTFPLHPDETTFPYRMITLVLGLSIETTEGAKGTPDTDIRRKRVKWIRRLAQVIMTEIPYLYSALRQRKPASSFHQTTPSWVKDAERDTLHSAVDDLHRKITDFAGRVGAEGWQKPENGFNFLIAFKELDASYQACLRYRLSLPNLHALGLRGGVASVADWRRQLQSGLHDMKSYLQNLFCRDDRDRSKLQDREEKFNNYIDKCYRAIEEIFSGITDLDEARRTVKELIESSPYRMRLTPGYYVMNLSHPEIIQTWLRDPRASGFSTYPERLLLWEATALPSKIYYSQVADGSLPIGVCGINAEIFRACPHYYELQEIIDESGARFRYIICDDEMGKLKHEFKSALKRGVGDLLWKPLLDRFRRLSYYHFPNPHDCWTKLVRDADITSMEDWKDHRNHFWCYREGLDEAEVKLLTGISHIPRKEGWWQMNDDFLGSYLQEFADHDRAFKRGVLHRIKVSAAEGISLLALIPQPRNNEFANALISRFLSQCENVYDEHTKFVETYGSKPDEPRELNLDVVVSYNEDDFSEVELIVNSLRSEGLKPILDKDMVAGEKWQAVLEKNISNIKTALVIIGKNGRSEWQDEEIQLLLGDRTSKRTIIPVVLPGAPEPTGFLKNYQWVDYNKAGRNANARLIQAVKSAVTKLTAA
jgi:hypothetical protein